MKPYYYYLLLIVLFIGSCNNNEKTGQKGQVVVCSYGGSYQEAQRKAFFEPFEKETGIKVIEANWSGEYAKIKAMVSAKNVQWDLVTSAEASDVIRGANDGILEKLDFSKMDKSTFLPGALSDYSQGIDYFSTALAYRTDVFKNDNYPKNWKDFWDLKKYPGKRSLRKDPRTTLEIALLADGVDMKSLYPLDLGRAFKSLDKIKNNIVWWTTGSQPVEFLSSKEVTMSSVFNGRVWAAVKKDHLPLQVEWNQGILDLDRWIIPKGAKNLENAMKLIEYSSRPEVQDRMLQYINYGPTIKKAYDHLSQQERVILPTSPENYSKQVLFDGGWWAKNEQKVLEQWNEWLLK